MSGITVLDVTIGDITEEVDKLQRVDGPHSSLYAMGAIDALMWVLGSAPPASEGGLKKFPVVLTSHDH